MCFKKKESNLLKSIKLIMVLDQQKMVTGSHQYLTILQAKWSQNLEEIYQNKEWNLNPNFLSLKEMDANAERIKKLTNECRKFKKYFSYFLTISIIV